MRFQVRFIPDPSADVAADTTARAVVLWVIIIIIRSLQPSSQEQGRMEIIIRTFRRIAEECTKCVLWLFEDLQLCVTAVFPAWAGILFTQRRRDSDRERDFAI